MDNRILFILLLIDDPCFATVAEKLSATPVLGVENHSNLLPERYSRAHGRSLTVMEGQSSTPLLGPDLFPVFTKSMHRWLGFDQTISAFTKAIVLHRRHPETEQMVEVTIADSIAVAAELENGVLANIHLTEISRSPSPNRIKIYGSEGTLAYATTHDKIVGV